jgi:hypothetical protein
MATNGVAWFPVEDKRQEEEMKNEKPVTGN